MVTWGTHPPAEEVLREVWQRDIASVPAKNEKSLSSPGLWVQIRGLAPRVGAETAPGRAFQKKLPNQLARDRRAPPPQPRPLPARSSQPSQSPFPFRPLPGRACASPRQDRVPRLLVQKSRHGSRGAEETPEWREEERERGVTGRAGGRAAAAASTSDLGTWTRGRKTSPGSTKAA